jgi:hypothetical protein
MAATPLIALVTPAAAQTYGPGEGEEIGPGVRVVALGERASVIPAYKMVKLRDVVIQASAKTPDNMMTNDMLCHMTEGELSVVQNEKNSQSRRVMFGPALKPIRRKARRIRAVRSQSCGSSI